MTVQRLVACMFAALIVASTGGAQAEIKTQWIEYTHGNAKLKGYLAYDNSIAGKRPGVLMVHRRDGMTPLTLKNTELYAKLGYVVFAPDIFGYGQGILPKDVQEQIKQMDIYVKDRALMRARTQAGLDVLFKSPMVDTDNVALIGYCMGGMIGVEMIQTGAPLKAMVAIHGSFRDHPAGWAKNSKGTKVLILHGAEDVPAPLPELDKVIGELRAAKADFQLELYSGTGHGFSVPKNKAEERANVQSIAATERFLKEVFARR
jgi:dienelactone hydrolase